MKIKNYKEKIKKILKDVKLIDDNGVVIDIDASRIMNETKLLEYIQENQ